MTYLKTIFTKEQVCLQERIRRAREAASMSQVTFAKLLGKTQSFVSKIESGERRLGVIELLHICRALNYSLIEFIRELEAEINDSKP